MTSPWSPGYGRQGHGTTEQMAPSQIDGSRAGLQRTAGAGVGTATCPRPRGALLSPVCPLPRCPGVCHTCHRDKGEIRAALSRCFIFMKLQSICTKPNPPHSTLPAALAGLGALPAATRLGSGHEMTPGAAGRCAVPPCSATARGDGLRARCQAARRGARGLAEGGQHGPHGAISSRWRRPLEPLSCARSHKVYGPHHLAVMEIVKSVSV